MVKRKHDPGYKLPEVVNPDENCCVCIPIPNDYNHKMAFLGQLDELGYWWNWERDTDKTGREAAAVWRTIVQCIREELNMSGCGCNDEGEYPVQERFNSDNELEASTDGGATWELAPERDARNAVVLFPPRQTGSADDRCLSAENATFFFKSMVDTILAQLGAGGGAAAAAPGVIALLVTIGFPTGLGAVLGLIYGLISAVIGLVTAGLEGTFDAAFYDALRCAFYCVVDEDGTLTTNDLDQVYAEMSTYLGGNVVPLAVVGDILTTVGEKGFTNAARGDSVPSSDCTDCDCPEECAATFEALVVSGTPMATNIVYDSDYIEFDLGTDYGYISTNDAAKFCFIGSYEVISGTAIVTAYCTPGNLYPSLTNTSPIGQCATTIEFQGSFGARVRVHMGDCP